MQIDIQSQGLVLDAESVRLFRRQVSEALANSADHIQHASLHLADINGRKGGVDKQCHLVVQLRGLPAVVVHETRPELYMAIGRALKRAQHSLTRRIGRHRHVAGLAHTPEPDAWSLA
jgi:hypothetical protein